MTRGVYDRSLSQRERKAEQRRKLLFAATQIFAKKGYAGASVEAIISEVGMSRRTFYEHFDDLLAILLAVHDGSARIATRLVEQSMNPEDAPLDRVAAGIHALLTLVTENGNLARVLFREVRAAGPKYELRRERLLASFGAMLARAIDEAHERGHLARKSDPVSIVALTAAVEAVGMRYVDHGEKLELREAVRGLMRMLRGAFSKDS